MTPLESQLRAGRERIANGWTQGKSARTADGTSVSPESDIAASFCAMGALGAWYPRDASAALAALAGALPRQGGAPAVTRLARFNDDPGTTQADVLALYDRAIEEASR